jgi:antitoxin CptB
MTQDLYKKLLYRSLNRGCKELDMLLGSFAEHNLKLLSPTELVQYQKIIQEDDLQLYEILLEKMEVPLYLDTTLIAKIIDFNTKKHHG